MRYELKEVDIISSAKIWGLVYGAMVLLFGVFITFFALLGAAGSEPEDEFSGLIGLIMGIGAIIFMPLFYGTMGFIFGAIGAACYNFIARFFGGIELTLEPKREQVYPPSPYQQTPIQHQ